MGATICCTSIRHAEAGMVQVTHGDILVSVHGKVSQGTVSKSEWMETDIQGEAFQLEVTPCSLEKAPNGPENCEELRGKILSYGKADLFDEKGAEAAFPEVKIGSQLSSKDGKIRIAIKWKETVTDAKLLLHFVVMSQMEKEEICPEEVKQEAAPVTPLPIEAEEKEEEIVEEIREEAFYVANPPKVLHPGWKYTLWTNMDPMIHPVIWTVVAGAGGGTITPYGEYTAPMQAGMYEVKATLAENGREASCYIVVRN